MEPNGHCDRVNVGRCPDRSTPGKSTPSTCASVQILARSTASDCSRVASAVLHPALGGLSYTAFGHRLLPRHESMANVQSRRSSTVGPSAGAGHVYRFVGSDWRGARRLRGPAVDRRTAAPACNGDIGRAIACPRERDSPGTTSTGRRRSLEQEGIGRRALNLLGISLGCSECLWRWDTTTLLGVQFCGSELNA